MIIQNFLDIARSYPRKMALEIINAGIEAVLVKNVIHKNVKVDAGVLAIGKKRFDLKDFEKLYIVGFGKASTATAEELEKILGEKITEGIVLDVTEKKLSRIKVRKCSHPVVSKDNVRYTQELLETLQKATKKDLVLCLVSGGGSAILADPAIPFNDYMNMNKALLRSGANIMEMNTIRKHTSKLKGDQLPNYANGATCVSMIFSDVIGDDLSFIASGPTVLDKTTVTDAQAIINKYHLPQVKLHETPKVEPEKVHNILLMSNTIAVKAMEAKAKALGLKSKVISTSYHGEAREMGARLASMAKEGWAIIAAGETTVTVRGNGQGGRNQELCLGALSNIGNAVVASSGTDGIDNTPVAGAVVDKETAKSDWRPYLEKNDAYNFLKKTKDHIITGPTGTNVADIMVVVEA